MAEAQFRQLISKLPVANEQEFLVLAKALQEILDSEPPNVGLHNGKPVSDFDVKQAGLHLWNGAVRLKQQQLDASHQNCESTLNFRIFAYY